MCVYFLKKSLETRSCKIGLHPHWPSGGKVYCNKHPANVRPEDEKVVNAYHAILFTVSWIKMSKAIGLKSEIKQSAIGM